MAIQEGDKIPEATVHHMTDTGPTPITTSELFSGKRSVLFAVPGAFTPGCSMHHLPGFIDNSDEILGKGVDQIVCLSVNDPFVMKAWCDANKAGNDILFLADGNASLSKAMGLTFDGSMYSLGVRSQRFAMILTGLKVEKLFVEKPGVFDVSSAQKVLGHLS